MNPCLLLSIIFLLDFTSGQHERQPVSDEERHLLVLPGSYGTPPSSRLLPRCPEVCRCYSNIALCSSKNIREIPTRSLPRKVAHLFLERNHIESIPAHIFARHRTLTRISFRSNRISDSGINSRSFIGLKKLKRLDLSQNELTRFPSELPDSLSELQLASNNISEIAANLSSNFFNLTSLYLQENNLTDAGIEPGTFRCFTALKNLNLNSNLLTTFPQDLPTSLNYLRIENNQLTSLPNNIFTSPSQVHHVYLRANQLRDESIPFTVWKNMSNLYFVDISQNQLRTIPRGLSPSLRLILLENNLIEVLHWQSFWGLDNLEQIRLSFNRISQISTDVFGHLSKLRYLNLSYNKLVSVPQNLPRNILRLYLQHNIIYTVPIDAFCDVDSYSFVESKLQIIQLNNNPLDSARIPALAFYCLSSMQVLTF